MSFTCWTRVRSAPVSKCRELGHGRLPDNVQGAKADATGFEQYAQQLHRILA